MTYRHSLIQYHAQGPERHEGLNVGVVLFREHVQEPGAFWRSPGPDSALFFRVLTSFEHLAARTGKADLDVGAVHDELEGLRGRLQERAEGFAHYKTDLAYRVLCTTESVRTSRFTYTAPEYVPDTKNTDDPEPILQRLFREYVRASSVSEASMPAYLPIPPSRALQQSVGRLALFEVRFRQLRQSLRAVLRDELFGAVKDLREQGERFVALRSAFLSKAQEALVASEAAGATEYPLLFERASGNALCAVCGTSYYDHPACLRTLDADAVPWLTQLCDGRLVKL